MADKKKPAKKGKPAPKKTSGKKGELSMDDLKKVSGGVARKRSLK